MPDTTIPLKLGKVDYDTLLSDADFKAEAKRILPEAMRQYSKAIAETMWESLKALAKSSGKSGFIREKSAEIAKDHEQRDKVEKYLISLLKSEKKKHPPKQPT